MGEKRFVQCEIEYGFANTTNIKKIDGIYDMQEEKTYRIEQIVDKLNEQDNELHKYRTENAELHITILENEKEIDEQQATIRKLQEENEQLRKQLDFYLLDEFEWKEKYGDVLDE